LHPRGEAVRRSVVNNVLEDIANTENMHFWMREGLEELEEVRTEKSNLVTIKEYRRGVTEVFYVCHCNENPIYLFLFLELCELSPNFHIQQFIYSYDWSTYFPAAE
jgi:hypothetical protein